MVGIHKKWQKGESYTNHKWEKSLKIKKINRSMQMSTDYFIIIMYADFYVAQTPHLT
jgi:hypothetical protein